MKENAACSIICWALKSVSYYIVEYIVRLYRLQAQTSTDMVLELEARTVWSIISGMKYYSFSPAGNK